MSENPDGQNGNAESTLFGNLLIAFLLAQLARWGLSAVGLDERAGTFALLIVMVAVMQADPIGSWRKGRPFRVVALKAGIGTLVGAAIAAVIPMDRMDQFARGAADALAGEPQAPSTGEASEKPSMISQMWWIFLMIPLLAVAPWLENLIRPRADGTRRDANDIQIAAIFPIYITVSLGMNLALLAAFWVLDLSVWIACALMLAAVLICISETLAADPEDLPDDDEMAEWGPRPATAKEAWTGLGKGILQSMASALFMATVVFVSMELALPHFPGPGALQENDIFGLLWGFVAGSTVMIVACIGFFLLGAFVLVFAAWAFGRLKGADPLSIADLAQHASYRLFAGGIHHVRPDLEGD